MTDAQKLAYVLAELKSSIISGAEPQDPRIFDISHEDLEDQKFYTDEFHKKLIEVIEKP